MIGKCKVCVVLPAYNAGRTLEMTFREISPDLADDVILVDDASKDDTLEVARKLGIFSVAHHENKGYGGNQKTCYRVALERGADIVIMLHPDYQYSPKLLPAIASMLGSGFFDVVLGSRILGVSALALGEGAVAFRRVLEPSGAFVPDDDSELHRVTAVNHCRIARDLEPSDPERVQPEYLRLPDAELARRAAQT